MFELKILSKDHKSMARIGEFKTPHGKLLTPELAFVATEGEIKSIPRYILPNLPVNLIITNTFHLWVKKILDRETMDYRDWKLDKEGRSSKIEKNQPSSITLQNPDSSFNHRPSSFSIHDYANFKKPIMSDSGGFQVFSLGFGKAHNVGKVASMFPEENRKEKGLLLLRDHDNLLNINEQGVMFNYDKRWFMFTPEMSIDIQKQIGADIMFAFDECTSPLNSHDYTKGAMERTHRWLKRCMKVWKQTIDVRNSKLDKEDGNLKVDRQTSSINSQNLASSFHHPSSNSQALFAVVQGGYYEDLRKQSAKFMGKQNVPGFGIGGTLGRSKEDMYNVIDWTIPYLPDEKPRHLLGIGQIRDIFEAVERGVDLFDCVIPTREARHRVLYTRKGRINLQKMRNVNEIIEEDCKCLACTQSVKYDQLVQLFRLRDRRAYFFATVHNIQFYADLMRNIRESIKDSTFKSLKNNYLKNY